MLQFLDRVPGAVKAAPTAGYVLTHTIMGLPWGTLASIAAFVYSALMILDWVWRKWRAWHRRHDGQ